MPYGGVATSCYHLARGLLAQGHQVYFYDTLPHPTKRPPDGLTGLYVRQPSREMTLRGLKLCLSYPEITWRFCQAYTRAAPPGSTRMMLVSLNSLLEMAQFFAQKDIRVIHSQQALSFSFSAEFLARELLKIPHIVTLHGSEYTTETKRPWQPMANGICARADAVICNSEHTRRSMLAGGAQPREAQVIYWGTDPLHLEPPDLLLQEDLRRRLNLRPDEDVILYVGWLTERKGPQVLLEALPALQDLPLKAIFIGPDHGSMCALEKRASELNLGERVTILGEVRQDELLAIYSLAQVFVFPTIGQDEGFGLVALEAMAHGLPLIASRTAAIPEVVVEGETGLFFEPGNVEALAGQLRRLLNERPLREAMGQAARRRAAEEFTWGRAVDQVLSVYLSALETTLTGGLA